MSGQITKRKNYELFIEVAKVFPQFNFIWLGGTESDTINFNSTPNIYHITYVTNPYAYYKQLVDYFILFSLEDPCPYVILENILLCTPTICWEKNIFTDYKHKLTIGTYIEIPGYINLESVITVINTHIKYKKTNKDTNKNTNCQKFIENFFSQPTEIIKLIESIN